ncbi:hypothetical protein ACWCQR_51270, partial [Streptomyces sp. NPDC002172]
MSKQSDVEALRSAYERDLAEGTDRFFEPRRTTCPWCASDRLTTRLLKPPFGVFGQGSAGPCPG